MKTIKVIDLLNKIANGEEAPKKIRIVGWCYKFEWEDFAGNYIDESENIDLMSALSCDEEELNREVEIIEEEKDNFNGIRYFKDGNCYMSISSEPLTTKEIEEDKKIEKLEESYDLYSPNSGYCTKWTITETILKDKINELIDIVNELKENK